MSKTTFGCGTFLPGKAPGSVTEFDGGGTIDTGGGGDPPDPPPPPPPIRPDPRPDPGFPVVSIPDIPPPGDTVPPEAGPGGGGQPGTPSTGGGGSGPVGPVGPGPTSYQCGCVVDSLDPVITPKGFDEEGCTLWEAKWTYTCKKITPYDRLVGKNPEQDWEPGEGDPGYGFGATIVNKGKEEGEFSCDPVGGGVCKGSCAYGYVIWKVCLNTPETPDSTSAGDLGNLVDGEVTTNGGGTAGGGLIVEGFNTNDRGRANGSKKLGINSNAAAGNNIISLEDLEADSILNTIQIGEIDLNDPKIAQPILKEKPYGIQDSVISFQTTPQAPTVVVNDTGTTEFFNSTIDSNLHYILKNINKGGDWDSRKAAGITPEVIYNNLNAEAKATFDRIKNYDGTNLNINQIFGMIGTRVLDGTLSKLSMKDLKVLASDSEERFPITIKRSSNNTVNEVAALALVDQNKFPLNLDELNTRDREVFKNWKVLPSDVDMYIPVVIGGEEKRYYINDDGTFIDMVTLSIKDGDYVEVRIGGESVRLFAKSERDHAFVLPEKTKQTAISLLGGSSDRTLTVSADGGTASSIEFESSLSSPRQDFYILSADLSSLKTNPTSEGSFLLKNTTLQFNLMDTSTTDGLNEAQDYIKYKANKRVFVLDDSDLILDYIEQTSKLTLTQTDIIADSPKENKTIPLLTRQIPWYILIYPTNRSDLNLFNSKSKIQTIEEDGSITRTLNCKTSIVPNFAKSQTNKFVRYVTGGKTGLDVYGNRNTQARQTIIAVDDKEFKEGYRDETGLKPISERTTNRQKTPFRVVREIIKELDTNYIISRNGIGKTLTEFDVYSKLNLQQFSVLSRLESFSEIKKSIRTGLIENVKIIPPIDRADARISFNNTQLVQRRAGAAADTFVQVKSTNTNVAIVPPDTEGRGGYAPAR